MKITKEFFTNLSKQKYLEYVRTRINLKEEKVQSFATIILTLIAFIFFSVFAILPTLTTIFELQRKLDDEKFVSGELDKKIKAISTLSQQYAQILPDLPLINAAIPPTASGPSLISKVRTIAEEKGVVITQMQISNIPLETQTQTGKLEQYSLILGVEGDYKNLIDFYDQLISFDRLITIKSMTLSVPADQTGYKLYLETKAYYMP